MDGFSFDERREFFLRTGMNEAAATVAALGREYRSEAEARAADIADEADDLADRMYAEAQAHLLTVPSRADDLRAIQQELAQVPARVEAALRQTLSMPPTASVAQLTTAPVVLDSMAESAVPAVQTALRMSEGDARGLVNRIYTREVGRGKAHADRYIATFAAGLRANVSELREVAPR